MRNDVCCFLAPPEPLVANFYPVEVALEKKKKKKWGEVARRLFGQAASGSGKRPHQLVACISDEKYLDFARKLKRIHLNWATGEICTSGQAHSCVPLLSCKR